MHPKTDNRAAQGNWGVVEWAVDARGRMPGREFLNSQNEADQAKIYALFKQLADTGQLRNREKFQKLTGSALFEFKSFQLRFLGDFRPGNRFIVAIGVRKKKQKASPGDLKAAEKILQEHDNHE